MSQELAMQDERNKKWFRRTADEILSHKLNYDENRNWEMIYCQVVLAKSDFIEMCEGDFLDSVKLFVEQNIANREEIVRGYNIAQKECNYEVVGFLSDKLSDN